MDLLILLLWLYIPNTQRGFFYYYKIICIYRPLLIIVVAPPYIPEIVWWIERRRENERATVAIFVCTASSTIFLFFSRLSSTVIKGLNGKAKVVILILLFQGSLSVISSSAAGNRQSKRLTYCLLLKIEILMTIDCLPVSERLLQRMEVVHLLDPIRQGLQILQFQLRPGRCQEHQRRHRIRLLEKNGMQRGLTYVISSKMGLITISVTIGAYNPICYVSTYPTSREYRISYILYEFKFMWEKIGGRQECRHSNEDNLPIDPISFNKPLCLESGGKSVVVIPSWASRIADFRSSAGSTVLVGSLGAVLGCEAIRSICCWLVSFGSSRFSSPSACFSNPHALCSP